MVGMKRQFLDLKKIDEGRIWKLAPLSPPVPYNPPPPAKKSSAEKILNCRYTDIGMFSADVSSTVIGTCLGFYYLFQG